jgi:phosphoglucosamine mutase
MRKLFGTDGVRGKANTYPMTTEMALQIGRATACIFKQNTRRYKVLVGRDTRISGPMIESALIAGICSMGVDVINVGALPTPAIAFLTSNMRADAGIMISASHNPFQDNGIKIFSGNGLKLPDEIEEKIEALIGSSELDKLLPTDEEIGNVTYINHADGRYIVYLKSSFPKKLNLNGLKIVLDCANGAGYKVAPLIFEELGAEVVSISNKPDGRNINLNCGAMHPEIITEAVKRYRANIGIALDGDADRVIFSDEKGKFVDGDHIMAICALDMKEEGKLNENTVVATVMSNMGFDIAMKNAGIHVIKTQVGDRYIIEQMIKHGYNFGGEQSGHLIFFDHTTTGDGLLAALQVLAVMKKKGEPLSELSKIMKTLPQYLLNVPVKTRKDLNSIAEVKESIKAAERKLNGKGRILVRYSGTQPICRIMVEGPSKSAILRIANQLADVLKTHLG